MTEKAESEKGRMLLELFAFQGKVNLDDTPMFFAEIPIIDAKKFKRTGNLTIDISDEDTHLSEYTTIEFKRCEQNVKYAGNTIEVYISDSAVDALYDLDPAGVVLPYHTNNFEVSLIAVEGNNVDSTEYEFIV